MMTKLIIVNMNETLKLTSYELISRDSQWLVFNVHEITGNQLVLFRLLNNNVLFRLLKEKHIITMLQIYFLNIFLE